MAIASTTEKQQDFEIKALTSRDRKKLQSQIWLTLVFLGVAAAIFWFIFNTILSSAEGIKMEFYFVFGLIASVFIGIVLYMFWSTYIDLKRGEKYCYTGIVTNKRVDTQVSKTTRHNYKGGQTSSRTSTRKYYYLTLNDYEHSVSYNEYSQVNTGDEVALEVSPKKREVLQFEVLTKSQQVQQEVDEVNDYKSAFIKSFKKQAARSQDVEMVKKLFQKKLKNRLWFLAFPAFLILLLWQTPTGIFLLFMLPLFIFILVQAIKLLKLLNKNAKFKSYKTKQVVTTQVLDKFTATSNRSATKNQLMTDMGSLEVSLEIYNLIKTKQVIEVHVADYLNIPFGISIHKSERFYSLAG